MQPDVCWTAGLSSGGKVTTVPESGCVYGCAHLCLILVPCL